MKNHLVLEQLCCLGHPTKRSIKSGVNEARIVLAQYLNLPLTDLTTDIHCCHACNDERCINPRHLYFGTASQNRLDVPKEVRSAAAADWDRGITFIAIAPSGTRFVADTLNGLVMMIGVAISTFYKYCKTEKPIPRIYKQRPTKWLGWRFIRQIRAD